MSRNDVVRFGPPIPKIAAVRAGKDFTIEVTWRNGRTETIDLTPMVMGFKVYRPLRQDRALFERVRVEDAGGGIVWTDGLDMAAYTLEALAATQRVMSTDDFRQWMKRHGLTLDTTAAALGISRRTAADISAGHRPMDLQMTLACEGYSARAEAARTLEYA